MKKSVTVYLADETLELIEKIGEQDQRDRSSSISKAIHVYADQLGVSNG